MYVKLVIWVTNLELWKPKANTEWQSLCKGSEHVTRNVNTATQNHKVKIGLYLWFVLRKYQTDIMFLKLNCVRKRFKILNQNRGLHLAEYFTFNHTHSDVSQSLQPLWSPNHTSVTIYHKEYSVTSLTQHPPMGHGLLIHEVSRSHTATQPQSVGHL